MLKTHPSKDQLLGYTNRTITDAEREYINLHLSTCSVCSVEIKSRVADQRVIRHALATDFRQFQLSNRTQFADIASRLRPLQRVMMFKNMGLQLASATVVIFVIAFGLFYVTGNLAPQDNTATAVDGNTFDSFARIKPPNPTHLGDGLALPGWHTNLDLTSIYIKQTQYQTDNAVGISHTVSLDEEIKHSGSHSIRLAHADGVLLSPTQGYVQQTIRTNEYRGQRVRVSAYFFTQNGDGVNGRIDVNVYNENGEPANKTLSSFQVDSSMGWVQHELVLDIPSESHYLEFGARLNTPGQLWVDDWQIAIVETDTPLTNLRLTELNNLGFENAGDNVPNGWTLSSSLDYAALTDRDTAVNGRSSGKLFTLSTNPDPNGSGTLLQSFDVKSYRGQRIRLSANIKTENVVKQAFLWMQINDIKQQSPSINNLLGQRIQGTTDWQPYEIIIDVPESSANGRFGLILKETGSAWIDNVKIEIISQETQITHTLLETPLLLPFPTTLTNGNFKADFANDYRTGWFAAGHTPKAYSVGIDEVNGRRQSNSGFIRSNSSTSSESSVSLMQTIRYEPYEYRRVRLNGYIRTQNVMGKAAPWIRIEGNDGTIFALANIQGQELTGTTEWSRFNLVLHVPPAATTISFGMYVQGTGAAWLDDVQLEFVDGSVPTTNLFDVLEPLNMGYED